MLRYRVAACSSACRPTPKASDSRRDACNGLASLTIHPLRVLRIRWACRNRLLNLEEV